MIVIAALLTASIVLACVKGYRELTLYRQLDDYQRRLATNAKQGEPPPLSKKAIPILLNWIESREPLTTGERIADSFLRACGFRVVKRTQYLRRLALSGFDLLGTNAVAALPKLARVARDGEDLGPAVMALVSVGEAAFPIALEFTRRSQTMAQGVFLFGALGVNPDVSVPVLLELIEEENDQVRNRAFTALAEFPSSEAEKILFAKLINPGKKERVEGIYAYQTAEGAGYALHSGSTEALLRLTSLCAESTNRMVRFAALSALILRDQVALLQKSYPSKHSFYQAKRRRFGGPSVSRVLDTLPEKDKIFDLIRSNIVATGDPRVRESLRKMERVPQGNE